MTLKYNFSGEGEEELKSNYKEIFEMAFGDEIAQNLINEKEVVFSFDDTSYFQYVTLNKENSTFSFILI